MLYNTGKYAEARKAYQALKGRVTEDSFEGLAVLNGLAALDDQENHPDAAAAQYETIAGLKSGGEGRQLALWSASRCWRDAHKSDQAIAALETLLKDFPNGRYADMTKQALAELRAGTAK